MAFWWPSAAIPFNECGTLNSKMSKNHYRPRIYCSGRINRKCIKATCHEKLLSNTSAAQPFDKWFSTYPFHWTRTCVSVVNVKYLPIFGVFDLRIVECWMSWPSNVSLRSSLEIKISTYPTTDSISVKHFLAITQVFHSFCTWHKINMHDSRCAAFSLEHPHSHFFSPNDGQPWDALWFWHDW